MKDFSEASDIVLDSEGRPFPLSSLEQTPHYDTQGRIDYIDATDGVTVWRQTITWNADGSWGGTSRWVKQ